MASGKQDTTLKGWWCNILEVIGSIVGSCVLVNTIIKSESSCSKNWSDTLSDTLSPVEDALLATATLTSATTDVLSSIDCALLTLSISFGVDRDFGLSMCECASFWAICLSNWWDFDVRD